MDGLKYFLGQNWVGTVIGIGGIFIGIIVAYFFKPRPRLCAQRETLEIVGPNAVLPHEIEFFFRSRKVPKVSLSKITIWNDGNVTIKGADIVNSDPLRIVVSDGNVLETTILHRTRDVNDFSCSARAGYTDNQIECRFDYLDIRDGALIQVIHTGTKKVDISGTVRGIRKGVRIVGNRYEDIPAKAVLVLFLFPGIWFLESAIRGRVEPPEDWVPIALIGLMLIIFGVLIFVSAVRMPPYPLSTQITSSDPKKSIWQMLREKMRGGRKQID